MLTKEREDKLRKSGELIGQIKEALEPLFNEAICNYIFPQFMEKEKIDGTYDFSGIANIPNNKRIQIKLILHLYDYEDIPEHLAKPIRDSFEAIYNSGKKETDEC